MIFDRYEEWWSSSQPLYLADRHCCCSVDAPGTPHACCMTNAPQQQKVVLIRRKRVGGPTRIRTRIGRKKVLSIKRERFLSFFADGELRRESGSCLNVPIQP